MKKSDKILDNTETFANPAVLDFYKKLPFNYNSSPEYNAQLIKSNNDVDKYFPIPDDFYDENTNILEIGCGTGWLSNMISYYYGCKVTGVDFNPIAIEQAKKVSEILGLESKFEEADLFAYEPKIKFDYVISIGVLHHTNSAMAGIKKISGLLKKNGTIIIGLYHLYGRKPFLDYFSNLKLKNKDGNYLLSEYRKIDTRHSDDMQAKSWFMDQVMHPHETQHTLSEVIQTFKECSVDFEVTSINNFNFVTNLDEIYSKEPFMYDHALERIKKGQYYSGFFVVVGRKNI